MKLNGWKERQAGEQEQAQQIIRPNEVYLYI